MFQATPTFEPIPHSPALDCVCALCIPTMESWARWEDAQMGIHTNASDLDAFYIAAFAGLDAETGEIVNMARYDPVVHAKHQRLSALGLR